MPEKTDGQWPPLQGLFCIKTVFLPFYRVVFNIFPDLTVFFFVSDDMVMEKLLPDRYAGLLCDIPFHLLNNG